MDYNNLFRYIKVCRKSQVIFDLWLSCLPSALTANLYPRARSASVSDGTQRVFNHCNINEGRSSCHASLTTSFIVRHVTVAATTATMAEMQQRRERRIAYTI